MGLVYIKYFRDGQQSSLMDWIRRIRERKKSGMVLFCFDQTC